MKRLLVQWHGFIKEFFQCWMSLFPILLKIGWRETNSLLDELVHSNSWLWHINYVFCFMCYKPDIVASTWNKLFSLDYLKRLDFDQSNLIHFKILDILPGAASGAWRKVSSITKFFPCLGGGVEWFWVFEFGQKICNHWNCIQNNHLWTSLIAFPMLDNLIASIASLNFTTALCHVGQRSVVLRTNIFPLLFI